MRVTYTQCVLREANIQGKTRGERRSQKAALNDDYCCLHTECASVCVDDARCSAICIKHDSRRAAIMGEYGSEVDADKCLRVLQLSEGFKLICNLFSPRLSLDLEAD